MNEHIDPLFDTPLSEREMQVLALLWDGKTTKQSAEALQLSRKTIESFRTKIFRRLGVSRLSNPSMSAVRVALRKGLLKPDEETIQSIVNEATDEFARNGA